MNNPLQFNESNKVFSENAYKLNFDGCSKGNPGLAGAGAVLYDCDKEIWSNYSFVGDCCTNNQAEYSGLILGLEKARELNIKHLKVEGDSLLIINQMKGLYKCKSSNLIELYNKAKELESYFENIQYFHVLRNKNTRADFLSNLALSSQKYIS